MSDPYIKLFQGVDYPILTASDLAKGAWRGAYEGLRSRPLKTSASHAVSQTIGSAIGRMVDTQDDKTGIAMLQGKNMVVQSIAVGLVSGGIDTVMERGGRMERFIVPVVVDGAVDLVASTLYNNDPRIL
jgi:hypothetical protein